MRTALLLVWLAGCHRPAADPAGGGPGRTSAPPLATPLVEGQLARSDILLQLARLPHADVAGRLGPHRIESHTHWTITPLTPGSSRPVPEVLPGFKDGAPAHPYDGGDAWENSAATLDETRTIQVDSLGALQLLNQNDHGYGIEALQDKDYLYVRMRNAPWVRHHPEADEVERLRAMGYEPGAALMEAVAPFIFLSTPSETTRFGRPAWQVSLSRQDGSGSKARQATQGPGKAWRAAVAVDALDGYAVVDRGRGTLLELRLNVRFQAPRGPVPPGTPSANGEHVQVEAKHDMRVSALGAQVANVQPPADWIDPPTRSRSTLEKQELLNGLMPARP